MAKGFILKGVRGESAGFLQQAGRTLRCKARTDGSQARLLIRYTDGSGEEQTMTLDGREHEWPCAADRAIACAYVAQDGRLLLVTDDGARRAFEMDRVRAQRRSETAPASRQSPDAQERTDRVKPSQRKRAAEPSLEDNGPKREPGGERERPHAQEPAGDSPHELPQRRWPPPPCWPAARYVSGRWTQD